MFHHECQYGQKELVAAGYLGDGRFAILYSHLLVEEGTITGSITSVMNPGLVVDCFSIIKLI
ncbi:hypothetical protein A9Q81_06635 [Gammaproteobacteria bacterium 42_54_T18]|nr:hypothetical protein A9Q81_06635 [Gammaproteobacteria bacterium 42_54_T18]